MTFMSSKFEIAIWSCDAGQRIFCFDRCQLAITWMSNIKEGHYKPRLQVSVNLLHVAGAWPPSCATPKCCCYHCAYAPTSNTASHDNHGNNKFVRVLCFPIWVWPFELPELHY